MKHDRVFGHLLILTAMICLGSSLVAGKLLVAIFPKIIALEFRVTLASLIVVPICLIQRRPFPLLDGRSCKLLAVQAVVGVVLANLLLLSSLHQSSPLVAGVSFGMLPIVVGALSFVVLRETMSSGWLIAALFSSFGTAFLIVGSGAGGVDAGIASGELNALGAALCAAIFTVISKRLTSSLSPVLLSALVSVICLALLLPFVPEALRSFDIYAVGFADWLTLVWWALASGVAYPLLLYGGMRRATASDTGVMTAVIPLTAACGSYAMLGEAISLMHALGAGCALLGVLFISPRFRAAALLRTPTAQPTRPRVGLATNPEQG